ncbi:hypothetical protein PALB_20130 [Pseudoalteromonas luteoviolacea B = ATCC 29581]|nr:hypothetical protein PALB_20130 [Pseudoalteromonas luteoviolacea B = ATCC 29581]
MKKIPLAYVLLATGFISYAHAAEVKVEWKEFKEYRDVYPSNEARGGFHKRVAAQFERHLNKLAEKLPEKYALSVRFDEVDLAGDVHVGINEIRVVKPIYFPRLTISYELKDASGNSVVKAEQVQLKDMAFMERSRFGADEAFFYDKRLLTDWFDDTLVPAISSKVQ